MNVEMAYLLGMIIGNGEIQNGSTQTTVTIEIPYKNLFTDDNRDVSIYVRASMVDIRSIIEPLIGHVLNVTQSAHSTLLSFTKPNSEYVIREILRLVGSGRRHSTMRMSHELFAINREEKRALLRGVADVTGNIRRSNRSFGQEGKHRVYIEIPVNWFLVVDIANMLRDVDVPIETIDFGHPNFRDANLVKWNEGKRTFWKKEHQIKIWANEFLPIGFNIRHKQDMLERYSAELLRVMDPQKTHLFYWEKRMSRNVKPSHPAENDSSLPIEVRGRHFDSWKELASLLGYAQ